MNFIEEFKTSKEKVVEEFRERLYSLRSGEISLESIEKIKIKVGKKITNLKNVSSISLNSKNSFSVKIFNPDQEVIKSIIETLSDSENGYKQSYSEDKKNLSFSLVPVTLETKNKLIEKCKVILEEGKIELRKLRKYFLNKISEEKSSDLKNKYKKEIELVQKKGENEIEDLFNKKRNQL